jgi:hypothetical protein
MNKNLKIWNKVKQVGERSIHWKLYNIDEIKKTQVKISYLDRSEILVLFKVSASQILVACTCNPSYLGWWNWEPKQIVHKTPSLR